MFDQLTAAFDRLAAGPRGNLENNYYRLFGPAYAAMLDEITGPGQWFRPDRQKVYMLTTADWGYSTADEMPYWHGVFDHPVHMRKHGFMGLTTWNNSALIGQPYRSPSPKPEAIRWLNKRGVDVWTRADLSLWVPRETHLVIAAKELMDLPAGEFGFTRVE